MEIKFLCLDSEFRHVEFGASGMARNEIRDELLSETAATIYIIEHRLELLEQSE